jgi:hypothetical protein
MARVLALGISAFRCLTHLATSKTSQQTATRSTQHDHPRGVELHKYLDKNRWAIVSPRDALPT